MLWGLRPGFVCLPATAGSTVTREWDSVTREDGGISIDWRCRAGMMRAFFMAVSGFLLLVPLVAVVLAKKPQGENVHRPGADCTACHTAERAALERDPLAARALLAPDLEERCLLCHGDQGPSHHTGIRPRKPVPDTLPLSVEGLITCATCHFMHGEPNSSDDFLRIDNSRGGLCLTCHELSELE